MRPSVPAAESVSAPADDPAMASASSRCPGRSARAAPTGCSLMTSLWLWRAGMTTTSPVHRGGSACTSMSGPAASSTPRWPRSSWAGRAAPRCAISRLLSVPLCCPAGPHRAVSHAPPLVYSGGRLSHCARRNTGCGARPGGLRHTWLRPARAGGHRRHVPRQRHSARLGPTRSVRLCHWLRLQFPRLIRGLARSGADAVGRVTVRRAQLPAA